MNQTDNTTKPAGPFYTIGQASQLVGVNPSTLKRWELIHQITPQRVANGQRIYTDADIRRLVSLKERAL